jgi:hypothetical protein
VHLAALGALLLVAPPSVEAHDVPPTVLVRAYLKPDGDRLRLLVRVPLAALRDVNWPVRGPGYLNIAAADSLIPDAAVQWIVHYVKIYEAGTELSGARVTASRIVLPSDAAFASYDQALAAVRGPPLAEGNELAWQQAFADILIEYPIRSAASRFSLDPEWAHLGVRTTTVMQYVLPDGGDRAFQYSGNPGLVHLDPRWHQAALTFVTLGFWHILGGTDHLLFVFCLVIPFRRFLPLVAIVTSFTVAHSITLIGAATGLAPGALWFPPLIETLIAGSILWMAIENVIGAKLDRRWVLAFGFGLVHGFGFSFVLSESLQFAGSHLASSLLAFNVGVELGQVFVLAVAVPALAWLFRRVVPERIGTIVLSALVAHTAWHWMTERAATLPEYDYAWPALDAAFVVSALRLLMLGLIVVGAVWVLSGVVGRLTRGATPADSAATEV